MIDFKRLGSKRYDAQGKLLMRRTAEVGYLEPVVSPFKAQQRLGTLEGWLEYSNSLYWRNQHVSFNAQTE